MKKQILALALSSIAIGAYASTIEWMRASAVTNFSQSVAAIQSQNTNKLPLYFPKMIPIDKDVNYYANYDITPAGYDLYIDASEGCKGAHYCNIITMNLINAPGALPVYKNMQGKVMTVTQKLDDGTVGSFTPGFAMGDYSYPQIAWQTAKITYTLSWAGVRSPDETRWAMLNMVNNLQNF